MLFHAVFMWFYGVLNCVFPLKMLNLIGTRRGLHCHARLNWPARAAGLCIHVTRRLCDHLCVNRTRLDYFGRYLNLPPRVHHSSTRNWSSARGAGSSSDRVSCGPNRVVAGDCRAVAIEESLICQLETAAASTIAYQIRRFYHQKPRFKHHKTA